MWLPDGRRSRAVLIGTTHYTDDHLPDLPAVERNISDLADILAAEHGLRLPVRNCERVPDATGPGAVLSAVRTAAKEAEDLLLVYYAGHGLLDRQGNLFLGLADSPKSLDEFWQAIDIRDIRKLMTDESPAANRILILDCCFSGRAFEAMGGGAADSVIEDMGVSGTFTMTSTSENAKAHAPEGAQHTAFTGALIDLLDGGISDGPEYLTLDAIYENVRAALLSTGSPEPKRRCVDSTGMLALVRNRAWFSGPTASTGRTEATPAARHRELSAHPSYSMIRRLLGWYIRECLPDPQTNQRTRWNVIALPSASQTNGRRLVTLNCGGQEAFFISEVTRPNGSRKIIAVCNIAPPSDRSLIELSFGGENVFGRAIAYEHVAWAWQFDLVDDLATLRGPIPLHKFVTLARQLNRDLMQAKSPNARFHNTDFAEDLFAAGREIATEAKLPFGLLQIFVDRADVESGNIGPTLSTLRRLMSSGDIARAAQGKVDLGIDGYNETPTELFEIEAVRAFIWALDREFPYWLFFSNIQSSSLQMIALCFVPPFLTREGKKEHFGPRLTQLVNTRWLPALCAIGEYAGLDDAELDDLSKKAIAYFTGPSTELLL